MPDFPDARIASSPAKPDDLLDFLDNAIRIGAGQINFVDDRE
jgi:hypothetical protein